MEQGKWNEPPVVIKKAVAAAPLAVGQPSLLEIPSLQLQIPVEGLGWDRAIGPNGELYSRWDDIYFAAGWHKNSAQPGEIGNVVMSGHNNSFGAVFRDLWRVQAGEVIYVETAGERFTYQVGKVSIMPEWNASDAQRAKTASYIQQTSDQRLTLVSCWPPNSNTHRVFVEAHLVPHPAGPITSAAPWQDDPLQLSE